MARRVTRQEKLERFERGRVIAKALGWERFLTIGKVVQGVMSTDEAFEALAVASIPRDVFEDLVESDNPPSVPELARLGLAYLRGEKNPEIERTTP